MTGFSRRLFLRYVLLDMEGIPVEKMEWFAEQYAQWPCVDRFMVVGTID